MSNNETKPLYNKHFIALSSLFILANGVIGLPTQGADRFTFLGFLICVLISVLAYFAVFLLFRKNAFFKTVTITLAVWCIATAFSEFTGFISEALLPETPKFLIYAVFGVTCVYFATKKQSAVLKFALIAFVFSLAAVFFFFFATAKDFEISNIFIYELPSLGKAWEQSLPYIKNILLPSLILPIYSLLDLENVKKRTAVCGLLSGQALLCLCILNSVLLFGTAFSGRLSFPYASAISTVTLGRLFTRMDGFAYFIYFSACLVKITACVSVIKKCLSKERHLIYKN